MSIPQDQDPYGIDISEATPWDGTDVELGRPVIAWDSPERAAAIAAWEASRAAAMAEIDAHKDEPGYFRRRQTTYGLMKRDRAMQHLRRHPDFYAGRHQARQDATTGQDYGCERDSAPYNAGYREAWDEAAAALSLGRTVPGVQMTPEQIATAKSAMEAHQAAHQARLETKKAQEKAAALPIKTPYDKAFVAAIKRLKATWDPAQKAWLVPAANAAKAQKLVAKYFPAAAAPPAPAPRRNQYAGPCHRCGYEVAAGAGHLHQSASGGWHATHASDADCEAARRAYQSRPAPVPTAPTTPPPAAPIAAPARRSGFRGELWQECEHRGCGVEPVCIDCFRCRDHCTCPPPPTAEETAAAQAARQSQADQIRASREALLARIDAPGFDPLSLPIQRQGHTGVFGTDWITETEPARIARFLDDVLQRESWYAPRVNRAPLTTRLELARYLVETGQAINYDSEWDAQLRIRPDGDDRE